MCERKEDGFPERANIEDLCDGGIARIVCYECRVARFREPSASTIARLAFERPGCCEEWDSDEEETSRTLNPSS
jgi:hypothetical protein